MKVNTNTSAINTIEQLRKNNNKLEAAMEKLSSGLRINKAGDDAAGLAISTRMTTQVRGMEVASRNASDGKSLLQTAESAMGSQVNIIQRIRELAIQADNGTLSLTDQDSLQLEVEQLKSELQHIAEKTQFNGITLLDGSTPKISFHISDAATDTVSVDLSNTNVVNLGTEATIATDNISSINIASATSTLYAAGEISSTGGTFAAGDPQAAINVIDDALDQLSSRRGELGAMQNRLDFAIDNLATATQNTTEARSRIEDADMALETSNMTKQKILSSASIAMLTQANKQPESILTLLQS